MAKLTTVKLKTGYGVFNAGERVGLEPDVASQLIAEDKAVAIQFVVAPPDEQPVIVLRDGRTDELVEIRKPAHVELPPADDDELDAELDEIFGLQADDLDEDA